MVLGLRLPATHAYIYMTQGQQLILSQRVGDDLGRVCVCVCVGTSAPPKGAGLHPLCGVRWWPPSCAERVRERERGRERGRERERERKRDR